MSGYGDAIKPYLKQAQQLSNCKYFLQGNPIGNTTLNVAFDKEGIYEFSNDWLYLLKVYYNKVACPYKQLLETYLKYKDTPPNTVVKGTSVLLSTSFSTGTIHGYVGIFEIISQLKNSTVKYDNYMVHDNAQAGIKNIITKFFPNHNIVYIKSNIIYEFESLALIRVTHHNFHFRGKGELELIQNIQKLLNEYFLIPEFTFDENIAVIKNNNSVKLTGDGTFNAAEVQRLCNRLTYKLIEPTETSEQVYYNRIYNCKNLILTWGTTYFKGVLYISDKCENITVLVAPGGYTSQYKSFLNGKTLLTKYKNATITYKMVDTLVGGLDTLSL
jgi:hypothetical protein